MNLSHPLVLIILAVLLLLPLVSVPEIFQVSEAREGVVIQEMLRTGEYILPLRHGEVVPSKPVFFHWLGATLSSVTSYDPETMLRSASLLSAILLLLAFYLTLKQILDKKAALLGTFVLFTSYGFVRLASDGRVDMLFNFFLITALLIWLRLSFDKQRVSEIPKGGLYLIAALLGFSFVTKGPLGLVLALVVILADSVFRLGGIRELKALIHPSWALCPLIALPWYYLAYKKQGGEFLGRQVIFENIARFLGDSNITAKPFWFYLEHIWSQFFPWSVILLLLVLLSIKKQGFKFDFKLSPRQLTCLKFAAVWLISTSIFLSLASGKRRAYLLSVLPALAIIVSIVLPQISKLLREDKGLMSRLDFVYEIIWGLMTGFFLLVLNAHLLENHEGLQLLSLIASEHSVFFYLCLAFGLVISTYLFIRSARKRSTLYENTAAFCLVLVFSVYPLAMSYKGKTHSYKAFAKELEGVVSEESELKIVKTLQKESYESLFYYYPRRIGLHKPESKITEPGYYLATAAYLKGKSLEGVEVITSGGRRTDEPGETLVLFKQPS